VIAYPVFQNDPSPPLVAPPPDPMRWIAGDRLPVRWLPAGFRHWCVAGDEKYRLLTYLDLSRNNH
jgi:hypothetical protein